MTRSVVDVPRKLHLAALVVVVALIVGLVIVLWPQGHAEGRFTDRSGRITMTLPTGWEDFTPDDAGQIVTSDDSGDTIDPRRLPDMAGVRVDQGCWFGLYVLTAQDKTVDQLHAEHVLEACKQFDCDGRVRPVEHVEVDGRPARAQFLSASDSADTLWTVTVDARDQVVYYTAQSDDPYDAQSGGRLTEPLNAIHIS